MKHITESLSWAELDHYLAHMSLPAQWMSDFLKLTVADNPVNIDAFSKCQLTSKFKTIQHMKEKGFCSAKRVGIVGAWYGQFAMMLHEASIGKEFVGIDLDPVCEPIAEHLNRHINYKHLVEDMYDTDYSKFDIVVNTCCEHIPNTSEWLDMLPPNKLVVLQSNNYFEHDEHVNCSQNAHEFIESCGPDFRVYRAITLKMPTYNRFIVLGAT